MTQPIRSKQAKNRRKRKQLKLNKKAKQAAECSWEGVSYKPEIDEAATPTTKLEDGSEPEEEISHASDLKEGADLEDGVFISSLPQDKDKRNQCQGKNSNQF
jgi:hypothetical protein